MLKPKATQKAAKLASCVVLSAALACTCPVTALATPGEDAQAQAQAALTQLEALNGTLEEAEARYGNAVMEKEAAEKRVDEAQEKIEEASGRINELQGKLGGRARSMYRAGSADILDLLLGATSFEEFATNWNLLERMNQADADMVSETKDLRSQVEAEKVVLEEQQEVARQAEEEAQGVVAEAADAQAQMQATYDSLSEEAAQLLAEEQAAREAAEEAANRAAAEAAAAQAAAEEAARQEAAQNNSSNNSSSSSSSSSSNSSSSSSNAPSYDSSTGNATVDRAYSQLGKPYVWGATGMSSFDCSGLVGYCLTGSTSRIGTTYTFMGWPRISASEARPGDIVTTSTHCGIYIGGGQMIHAPHTGDVVKISAVQSAMIYVRCPW